MVIKLILEIIAVVLILVGIYHEDEVIEFEDYMVAYIKHLRGKHHVSS